MAPSGASFLALRGVLVSLRREIAAVGAVFGRCLLPKRDRYGSKLPDTGTDKLGASVDALTYVAFLVDVVVIQAHIRPPCIYGTPSLLAYVLIFSCVGI